MKITNKKILIYCSVFAFVLFGLAVIWLFIEISIPNANTNEDHEIVLKYLSFEFDVFKAIIIGYLIAVLGLIIPNILPEIKYEFEMKKKGRKVFSKAKTGIDYLKFELADLNRIEARKHIHQIHELKHLADLYMKEDNKIAKWPYKKPFEAYEIIMEYLNLIENTAEPWDKMSISQRRNKLREIDRKISA